MKTLLTHITLMSSSLILALSPTSCNKDDQVGVDTDSSAPNFSVPRGDAVSKHQDSEMVEFDGFVNISAPIVQGADNEGIMITEFGIEMPVFRTSESADSKKRNQEGEPQR